MNDCSLNDLMRVSSPLNLNISHMKLVDIMASADSIGFHIDSLKADSSNFLNTAITDLKGSCGISRDQIDFSEMYLKWGATEINSEINLSLTYGDWIEFKRDNLFVNISLGPALIDIKDFNLQSYLKNHRRISLELEMKGYLNDLQISSLSGILETGSMFNARGRISGIPGIDSAIFKLELIDSYLVQEDLKSYLRGYNHGPLRFAGSIQGNKDEMLISGEIINQFGNMDLDLNLMNLLGSKEILYHGKVDFDDFHLGKIINDSRVGRSVGRLIFEGSGSDTHTMNSNLFVQFEDFIFLNEDFLIIFKVLSVEILSIIKCSNTNRRSI